ncbi:EamA family transporter RarD [Kitasatospora albolonga]
MPGLGYGFAAYGIWGLFPLYWPLLEPSGAVDILANRMAWSLVAVALMLAVMRKWAWIRPLLAQPRRLALSALGAVVVSVNWGVYIWGVNSGHVVETSLGYFINPLGDHRLRRPAAGRTAAPGPVGGGRDRRAGGRGAHRRYGRLPWIALVLALSFGTYGLLKKKVALGGTESLALETAAMFPFAVGLLVWLGVTGRGTFGTEGWAHSGLLMLSGLITAVPLLCFGAAAVRVPLSTLGLLQYLAPVLQFLLGITVFHERMPPARWAGFALVWAALAVLTFDALRRLRQSRSELPAAPPSTRPEDAPADAPSASSAR